jgi:hypothetical protein
MLGVFGVLTVGGGRIADRALAAAIAAALIATAANYPAVALGVLLVFAPFQLPLLAWALKQGAPAVAVRDAGYIKDAMVVSIGIAAVRFRLAHPSQRRRFGLLEYAAAGYIAIATAYLMLPFAFPDILGGQPWSVRISAWRIDSLFVVLLLFCRHAPFSVKDVRRLAVVGVLVGVAMFGSVLWEFFDQASYSNFFVHTVDLTTYEESILHITPGLAPFGYVIHNTLESHNVVRAGGFFTDQIELGFFSVMPFAIATQFLIGSTIKLRWLVASVAAGATALLALTRSAILACGVALVLIVYLGYTRNAKSRVAALLLVVAAVFAIIPVASHSDVGGRFDSLFGGNATGEDNQDHYQATRSGFDEVFAHPTGRGLGANPGTGERFHTTILTVTENSYLQVGTELGVGGMVVFVLMYLAALRELWRRSRDPGDGGELAAALLAAGGGLLIGGLFLQIWIEIPISLTFWGLVGAVLATNPAAWSQAAEPGRSQRAEKGLEAPRSPSYSSRRARAATVGLNRPRTNVLP